MSILSTVTAAGSRVPRSLALRTEEAGHDAFIPAPVQMDNGDEERYQDKSGTYTKGILQEGVGLVDPAAYDSFKKALQSGDPADFAKIVTGGPRTQNGPQTGLAFFLDCPDNSQFAAPPAPALASEAYATELVELYWASLLRDIAFTDYKSNPIAIAAAAELSGMPEYAGPRKGGQVTTDLLFRGGFGDPDDPANPRRKYFADENIGPYLSQFLLQPTRLGSLPITQQYFTNKSGVDFMLDEDEFQKVQNGIDTGKSLTELKLPLYLHDGRGLAAYTHDDVLYEAYFIAYLVLNTINTDDKPAPLNPGNPYLSPHRGAKTQNGFGTMGQPDIAATLTAVAGAALKAVWYQKWYVHLRHRPESGGAIVHLQKTGKGNTIQGHVRDRVLDSMAVQKSHAANHNSYYLSQAFPEGSPTHPAYPTGHGAVAGACITVLKFFFDGSFQIPKAKLLMPSSDGKTCAAYMPPAGEPPLTVNGELHKLAHNISFGHGIHAGIHWRSDTDTSIELGETVALHYLQEYARTYNEKFSIALTKVDGTVATISNL
jgi:hypothetical protein